MFNQQNVIKNINTSCSIYFNDSTFLLQPNRANRFSVFGSVHSKAINRYKNSNEEINVVKWFKDFWIYVDIRFEISETEIPNTFISLSIFQGEINDNRKFQLFRAEWDNFEDNTAHPQPHWHIYSDQKLEQTFDEIIDLLANEKGFEGFLETERAKSLDLKNMHFAMNGNFGTKGTHIHKINDEQLIVNWFVGVLAHIKSQLDYVS